MTSRKRKIGNCKTGKDICDRAFSRQAFTMIVKAYGGGDDRPGGLVMSIMVYSYILITMSRSNNIKGHTQNNYSIYC